MPAWLTAAATVALAFVGIREIVRAASGARERRRGYAAELHAHAYALRRQLHSWLGQSNIKTASAAQAKAKELTAHFDIAEHRALAIVVAATNAQTRVSESWRAYRSFYEATQLLNRLTAEVADPDDPLGAARRSLTECLGYLDVILEDAPLSDL